MMVFGRAVIIITILPCAIVWSIFYYFINRIYLYYMAYTILLLIFFFISRLSAVNDVKLRWKRLRDNFRVSIKRTKGLNLKPGLPFVEGKPWKYQREMEFLLPFMQIGGWVVLTLSFIGVRLYNNVLWPRIHGDIGVILPPLRA